MIRILQSFGKAILPGLLIFILASCGAGKEAQKDIQEGPEAVKAPDISQLISSTQSPEASVQKRIRGLGANLYKSENWTLIASKPETKIVYNKWNTVTIPITLKNIEYTGYSSYSEWTDLDMFRIMVITPEAGQAVDIFFDDLKLTNNTITSVNIAFEKSPPPFYLSKGTALEGNKTLTKLEGENCLRVHARSEETYGSIGVEFQYNMEDAPVDLSGLDYTVSFRYYIPLSPEDL